MNGKFLTGLSFIILLAVIGGCARTSEPSLSAEKKRELANVLYNQQLYKQAAAEYEDYLRNYPLSLEEQTNISYQIANIYFERLQDYENALAYYLRAKHLKPNEQLKSALGKKIVECLERLHRSTDARQEMAQSAALDESQKPKSRPGEVLARIGDRDITTGDLQYQLSKLPEYLQPQFQSPEAKKEFLRQYIAQELLYESAKRAGLDNDPEVLAGAFEAKKSLMAEKLLQQQIEQEAGLDKYTNDDVALYYKANKEKYAEKDKDGNIKRILPFEEVAQQVARDFMQEKKQQAYQRILERLMTAEHVVIYEDKIK